MAPPSSQPVRGFVISLFAAASSPAEVVLGFWCVVVGVPWKDRFEVLGLVRSLGL